MYWIIVGALRWLSCRILRIQAEGQENIPQKGPLLVVFNHASALDAVLIFFLPFPVVVLGAYAHRFNIFVLLGRALGRVILIRRGEVDRRALRRAKAVLQDGQVLVVSPEGTRTAGKLIQAKTGAAYLALQAEAPLLPVGIIGAQGSLVKALKLQRPKITIRFGPTFTLEVPPNLRSAAALRKMTDEQIVSRIVALLPKELHGYYRG